MPIKNKIIFLGDTNSINLEIIVNSFKFLENKVNYYVVGSKIKIKTYLSKIQNNLNANIILHEIFDPLNFDKLQKNKLNIYDISHKKKFNELINQIQFCNKISNLTGYDLITMPIDKSIFKKEIDFIGMTEYLGKINNSNTIMAMMGNNFSIVPITTHININLLKNNLTKNKINNFFYNFLKIKKKSLLLSKFKGMKMLCINPHCGENGTIGKEDILIKKILKQQKMKIKGPIPADSAFTKDFKNYLFFSTYHDQALIPFKILNKKSFNFTLGLNYKRLSPAHGVGRDIIYKNISDNTSYIQCMLN